MICFDLSTHIYRPLKQVFMFVASPENDFQWQYGTLASTRVSNGEVGVGTLFRTVGHFLGRRVEILYEVIAFEPSRKYGFRSVAGPVDSRILYTFDIAQGCTNVHLAMETKPADPFLPEGAIVVKKFKKQNKENLAMLKNVLEAQQIVRT